MTPPAPSPAAPVDTSAEAVARMVDGLRGANEPASMLLAAVVKERDAARAFVNGTMTEKLAEAIELTKFWREKADTASRQRAEARAANERDRCAVASVVGAVRKALMTHEWLRLGRGSYEYDDDRWKDEFSAAYDAVVAAIEPLRKIAADWTNCPTTQSEIAEARALLCPKCSEDDAIYYCAEHDNFYCSACSRGLGQAFYERNRKRRHLFPSSPSALRARQP